MDFHRRLRAKSESDQSLEDADLMQSQYPDVWADLADKGYQGLADDICCIHPEESTNLLANVERQKQKHC
uniref:DDE Tnp4 domain-containing protein n=1 Tax=Globisporangium ultimum (strain ATCC 200006 / CBS 805.95 / DAOM BR144) TaxID=431595 RepID=K3WAU8_GLOUD